MSTLPPDQELRRARLSVRNRLLFFVVAWGIVLMPFLFWRSTWFGRDLNDKQMAEYLRDDGKPRHIQHALVQMGERIAQKDPSVQQWYPELPRLAKYPTEEIRNTAAWVMGQDNTRPEFREALRGMLDDSSRVVRYNAALALVRFGDSRGRPQLVEMLQPVRVVSQQGGRVSDIAKAGTAINHGGTVAVVEQDGEGTDVRSPVAGRVRTTVERGSQIEAGTEVAVVDPGAEQVWEALRALYLVGTPEDLPAIQPFTRASNNMPERVQKQAEETVKAIESRL